MYVCVCVRACVRACVCVCVCVRCLCHKESIQVLCNAIGEGILFSDTEDA